MSDREQFEAWWSTTGRALCGCSLVPDHTSPNQVFAARGFGAGFAAGFEAARAQSSTSNQVEVGTTVQAGRVLTDDFIKAEALEAFDCYWDADDETLVNKYGHGVYLSRFIDFARAIEQSVLAKRVPQWQPIETARKDGTELLAHTQECGALVMYWDEMTGEVDHWSDGMSRNRWNPTHWMPLPPPPGIGGEKGGA